MAKGQLWGDTPFACHSRSQKLPSDPAMLTELSETTSFSLMRRQGDVTHAIFMAFDLLSFYGHDFTKTELVKRRHLLEALLPSRTMGPIRLSNKLVGTVKP